MTNPRVIPIAQRAEFASDDGEGFPVAELKADPFGALFITLSDAVQGVPLNTQFATDDLELNALYLATLSAMYAWDELGSGDLVKLRAFAAGEDVSSPQTDDGWLATNAALMLYNSGGSTVNGLISADTAAATIGESGGNNLQTAALGYLHTGATFVRAGCASSGLLSSATSGDQAALATAPGEWTLTHAPVANTQATATRAAGAAGVRHVLRSIQASINAVAAIVAPLTVVVRDGASGAGAILWQDRLTAPAGTDGRISLSGLNIVGSAATAMTVEFTAAPGATNFETVSATGYSSAAQAA